MRRTLCHPLHWHCGSLSRAGGTSYACPMLEHILGIRMEEHLPAGALGPFPVALDIRAYLVAYGAGLVLVDTGMDPSGSSIDAALKGGGADWSDVRQIVLTHGHLDHIGGLHHARSSAPSAVVRASPLEMIDGAQPLTEGAIIGSLRAFATPGHTPGHMSLYDEDRSILLVGDCLGVIDGKLVRAPARFTSDRAQAERSLRRLLELRGARMLFAHGPEIDRPWDALDELLMRG